MDNTVLPHESIASHSEHFVLLLQVNPNSLGSSSVIVRVSLVLSCCLACFANHMFSTGMLLNFATYVSGRTWTTRTSGVANFSSSLIPNNTVTFSVLRDREVKKEMLVQEAFQGLMVGRSWVQRETPALLELRDQKAVRARKVLAAPRYHFDLLLSVQPPAANETTIALSFLSRDKSCYLWL